MAQMDEITRLLAARGVEDPERAIANILDF